MHLSYVLVVSATLAFSSGAATSITSLQFASSLAARPKLNGGVFKTLFKQALCKPQITTRLSCDNLAIMQAIERDAEVCKALFEQICNNYSLEEFELDGKRPLFWQLLINNSFRHFAQTRKEDAQRIVDQIVIPEHPFSVALKGVFKVDAFLKQEMLTLNSFLDELISPLFNLTWKDIFTKNDWANPQYAFENLLCAYSLVNSWQSGHARNASSFLAKAGFANVKASVLPLLTEQYDFYSDMEQFAMRVYDDMSVASPEKAQSAQYALRNISPSLYDTLEDQSYRAAIAAYLVASEEPTHAERLRGYIEEALKTPETKRDMTLQSHSILNAIHQDSHTCRGFFEHLCQTFSYKYIRSKKEQHGFWDRFVEIPFLEFFEADMDEARAIIQQVIIPNNPILCRHHDLSAKVAKLFDGEDPESLVFFVDDAVKETFLLLLGKDVLSSEADPARAKMEFVRLVHDYSQAMSWKDPRDRYATAFLMEAGLAEFKLAAKALGGYGLFLEEPAHFAAQVYAMMQDVRSQLILLHLQPAIYPNSTEYSYEAHINFYINSGLEPMDLEHFGRLIKNLLKTPVLSSKLSDAHIFIFRALCDERKEEVLAYKRFFYYMFYAHPNYESMKIPLLSRRHSSIVPEKEYEVHEIHPPNRQLYFWRSLIFSSMRQFLVDYPDDARQILSRAIPNAELTAENIEQDLMKLFADDLLNGFTFQYNISPILYAANWGHLETVKHIFNAIYAPGAFQIDEALLFAAKENQQFAVQCLMKSGAPFSEKAKRASLVAAAEQNYILTVSALIEYGMSAEAIDAAFLAAARGVCDKTFNLLIQHLQNSDVRCQALADAVSLRDFRRIKFILPHVSSQVALKTALANAFKNGNFGFLELLLTRLETFTSRDEVLRQAYREQDMNLFKAVLLHVNDATFLAELLASEIAVNGGYEYAQAIINFVNDPTALRQALERSILNSGRRIASLIITRLNQLVSPSETLKQAYEENKIVSFKAVIDHVQNAAFVSELFKQIIINGSYEYAEAVLPSVGDSVALREALELSITTGHFEICKLILPRVTDAGVLAQVLEVAVANNDRETARTIRNMGIGAIVHKGTAVEPPSGRDSTQNTRSSQASRARQEVYDASCITC